MAARASAAEEQRSARAATTIGRHTRGTLVRQRSAYLAVEVAPLVRRMVAPPVALVVWDFDRTVLRVHAFKRGVAAADVPSRWARDVADAELFKATVAAARARGRPVAIASFGHKDVILAYLACIFGGDGDGDGGGGSPFDAADVLTPADVADSERRGSVVSMHSLASVPPPTGKPRMLRLLCKRHGVADRASVLFFDDDERNVADCVADGFARAHHTPRHFERVSMGALWPDGGDEAAAEEHPHDPTLEKTDLRPTPPEAPAPAPAAAAAAAGGERRLSLQERKEKALAAAAALAKQEEEVRARRASAEARLSEVKRRDSRSMIDAAKMPSPAAGATPPPAVDLEAAEKAAAAAAAISALPARIALHKQKTAEIAAAAAAATAAAGRGGLATPRSAEARGQQLAWLDAATEQARRQSLAAERQSAEASEDAPSPQHSEAVRQAEALQKRLSDRASPIAAFDDDDDDDDDDAQENARLGILARRLSASSFDVAADAGAAPLPLTPAAHLYAEDRGYRHDGDGDGDDDDDDDDGDERARLGMLARRLSTDGGLVHGAAAAEAVAAAAAAARRGSAAAAARAEEAMASATELTRGWMRAAEAEAVAAEAAEAEAEADGATLIIHLDLNKTILAVDEVKGYGREEVVYLEEFKGDADFLSWAQKKYGADAADADAWIAELKVSKHEPELIAHAKEYAKLNPERLASVEAALAKIRPDNSVDSFWRLLAWATKEQSGRVLVVFRTYGVDMPDMFTRCEANGYGEYIARRPDDAAAPLIWTVLHRLAGSEHFAPVASGADARDVLPCAVGGGATEPLLQPWHGVPGPKEKGTPEFKGRTELLEKSASAQFAAGAHLEPVVYLGPAKIEAQPAVGVQPAGLRLAPVDAAALKAAPPVAVGGLLPALRAVKFGGARLRIMGIQDDYKAWSRKNWRNGKPFVVAPPPAPPQLIFDDYSFTKGDAEGTYIQALYTPEGALIDGDKPTLQAKLSGEKPFAGAAGNSPLIFTALLNKKGKPSAVSEPEYFVERVTRSLALLTPAPEAAPKLGRKGSLDLVLGDGAAFAVAPAPRPSNAHEVRRSLEDATAQGATMWKPPPPSAPAPPNVRRSVVAPAAAPPAAATSPRKMLLQRGLSLDQILANAEEEQEADGGDGGGDPVAVLAIGVTASGDAAVGVAPVGDDAVALASLDVGAARGGAQGRARRGARRGDARQGRAGGAARAVAEQAGLVQPPDLAGVGGAQPHGGGAQPDGAAGADGAGSTCRFAAPGRARRRGRRCRQLRQAGSNI